MAHEGTPPNSPLIEPPAINRDDIDDVQSFDESDIVEIIEEDVTSDVITANYEEPEIEEPESLPERDDACLIFTEHNDSVLSCQFHPKLNNIVVSGGMDDTAFLWDATNGNKLFTCKGHQDSVEIVTFSHDGNYLATCDLSGVIKVWRIRDNILVSTFELEDELGWLQWHDGTNVLVASSLSGMIYMYRIPSGETKMVVAPFGHNCLVGKILPDGKKLACGYKDGSIKIVNLKEGITLNDVKPYEDIGGITSLDAHKANNLIICGCESGVVMLINSNNGKITSVLQNIKNSDGSSYIEAVAFCKDYNYSLAASGSLDGTLIIWDFIKQTIRHQHHFSSCINHLAWHPSLPILFTCHYEGIVRAYDAKAGVVLKEYLGHQKNCLNMSLSRDGSFLITASEDKTVRIFSVGNIS